MSRLILLPVQRTLPKFRESLRDLNSVKLIRLRLSPSLRKAVEKREALEKDKPTKTKNEIITEEAVRKPIQKEGYSQSNPTVAKTDKNPPSRHDSEPVDMQTDKGTVSDRQRKPSVKAKLDRYKAQSKQQKEAERKEPEVSKPEVKNAPAQTVHQQPKPKSKNVKER